MPPPEHASRYRWHCTHRLSEGLEGRILACHWTGLYRTTHSTFEDYCQERFGISRQYANKRIVFASMLDVLETRVSIPPATEGQARPLAKLETPEQQAQAWTNQEPDT